MLANVVKLETDSMYILECVKDYFKYLDRSSRDYEDINKTTSTSSDYERDIRLFFRIIRNKEKGMELEHLTMEDVQITLEDFKEYVTILCDMKDEEGKNKYVNNTINKKIAAVKGLIKHLSQKKTKDGKEYLIKEMPRMELLKSDLKVRKVHYGALEVDEVLEMANRVTKVRNKGKIKRLLILTAFKTGLRKSELLELKWGDFKLENNDVIINGIGKGNKEFKVKITDEFYQELLELDKGKEKVFDISVNTVDSMMQELREKMNIDPERKIVFHSIRKAFGTHIYRTTNDIDAARRALRHSSIVTTQVYLGVEDYNFHSTIFDIDNLDSELYKKVSHEDLLKAISMLNKKELLQINMKIQEGINVK